jgi:DNA-binding NarL/FixJ family response regulator
MKPITVLLADDHRMVREGFRALLQREPDIEVIAEAGTGREALQLTRRLRPAVVVMDIAMPLLNGLEASRQIQKAFPNVRLLILSAHSDDAYIEQTAKLGLAGYLLKQTSSHNLPAAIRAVQKGEPFFSPAISQQYARRAGRLTARGKAAKGLNRLSERETEVLQLIAEGMANKQIAAELGVRFKTIDKHRQHLMTKLDIHDVAGLTRYAVMEGIIKVSIRVVIT